jgi:hypothetical protein
MIWPNIDMISRMNNLTQTIARAFSHQFSDFGRRVHTLAQELNEEQFWIKPYSYGNSFGNLVLHLTGNLNYYGADGFGHVIIKTRLIEVATGKVKQAGETKRRSTSAIRTTGAAEMQTKTLKPAIEKLTATLAGLTL